MSNPKIDIHTHICRVRRSRPASFWNPDDNYQADPDEMVAHLKRQGVFKAIGLTNAEDPDSCFDAMVSVSERYPDFFRFSCNFTKEDDPKEIYKKMAAYRKVGAVSVGELSINEWINHPIIDAVFAAAEKLEMPVTFHMSPEPGFAYGICDHAGLPLLEEALQKYPNLIFLGHSQTFWIEISGDAPREGNEARSKLGSGPVVPGGALIRLMDRYPNLYGDLSAYSASRAIMRDEAFGLAFLEKYQDRLMYGSDSMNQHQIMPLGTYLDSCAETGKLSEEAYEKICFKNAEKVFHI